MPTTVAVGEKLPAIQSAAKALGNGITALIGAGLITVAVLVAPDQYDELILEIGAGLTLFAGFLVTWATRNSATVPLIVAPTTAQVDATPDTPTAPPAPPVPLG
jgi:hypothetical protein